MNTGRCSRCSAEVFIAWVTFVLVMACAHELSAELVAVACSLLLEQLPWCSVVLRVLQTTIAVGGKVLLEFDILACN